MTVIEHPASTWADVVDASAQLVDVREPDEVRAGTLPGAINVPLDRLLADPSALDPSRRVVLLCRSGNRSGIAARHLAACGFTDVVNLTGGLTAVDRSPLDRTPPEGNTP